MGRSQSAYIHGGLSASMMIVLHWKDAGLRMKTLWLSVEGSFRCEESWSSTQGWRRTLWLSLCWVPRGQAGIILSFVSEEPHKRTIIIHRILQGKGMLNTPKLPGGGEPSGMPWTSLLFWDSPVCLIGGDHPCTGWTLMLVLHSHLASCYLWILIMAF